jgi:hypothetical protein
MSNPRQGWKLRLHTYNIRGNGLGGEDSPHYHRWTLASKVFAGGYLNKEYEEGTVSCDTEELLKYNKYKLASSAQQTDSNTRVAQFVSEATMTMVRQTVYA